MVFLFPLDRDVLISSFEQIKKVSIFESFEGAYLQK